MQDRPKILIVDDEEDTREIFSRHLQSDYTVNAVPSAKEAIIALDDEKYHVALTDLVMPEVGGLELLSEIKKKHPEVAVIVISGKATIDMAVTAIKKGAEDFIEKPVEDLDLLNIMINKIMKMHWQKQEITRLRNQLAGMEKGQVIGNSMALQQILEKIKIVAPLDTTAMVTGETGVGKELIAELLYRNSKRKNNKFVIVHCGSLPENLLESTLFGHKKGSFTDAIRDKIGYFEEANGGTLFLDEITETSPAFQTKILRVLEKGVMRRVGGDHDIPVDVRVIAASNKDIGVEVEKGNFREDLYYRLNVIHFHIPPLRQRPEDIPVLINFFLKQFARKHEKPVQTFSDAAMSIMTNYDWRGNVRELKNAVEHSVVLSKLDAIVPEDLPVNIYNSFQNLEKTVISEKLTYLPFFKARDLFEKQYLIKLLERHNGDVTKAADISGIKRQNLYEKFSKYVIDPKTYRK